MKPRTVQRYSWNYINIFPRIPTRGLTLTKLRANQRSDFGFSVTSASRIFKGRKRAIAVLGLTFTRKPLLPYSRLIVCRTMEFSPTLVWPMTMSSAFSRIWQQLASFPATYFCRPLSHCAIARRALPRCEISFFCSSVMSAAVSPGYSSGMNIGS